jgi:microcystin-dependent protein
MADTANFAIEKPTPGGFRNIWGGTLNTGFDKLDELIALAMPLGTIQIYPLVTAPVATTNGGTWLVCNGGSLAQVGDYAALYGIIGTTYGTGASASGTFSLPDMRARVPLGYSVDTVGSGDAQRTPKSTIGGTGGAEAHTLLDGEIPKHIHPITDSGHVHTTSETAHTHTGSTSSSNAVIVDPGHDHDMGSKVGNWDNGSSYATLWVGKGNLQTNPRTVSNTTSITDSGHSHPITGADLASVSTGLTIVNNNTDITVDDQATGDGSHSNMQPYQVFNYIILAKHPTFT